LGKAITYLLRHWKALTAFLREAGVPLDNNYTPTHASWVNLIECFFSILSKQGLAHSVQKSKQDLKDLRPASWPPTMPPAARSPGPSKPPRITRRHIPDKRAAEGLSARKAIL